MKRKNYFRVITLSAIALLFVFVSQYGAETKTSQKPLKFIDVRVQTSEFIGYYNSIKLTPEQEKIKIEALSGIPAPCCKEYSIATCCCPCNLAKSVWGLSNYGIAKLNYNASKLKETILQWIRFTHKKGHAGNACFEGRCGSPFAKDGCGGMQESNIVF